MLTLQLRRAIVYAATGAFFLVAAMGQIQGATGIEPFAKAAVAALVIIGLGIAFVSIVDDAEHKAARGTRPGRVPASATQATGGIVADATQRVPAGTVPSRQAGA